jgi:hypothetical protein
MPGFTAPRVPDSGTDVGDEFLSWTRKGNPTWLKRGWTKAASETEARYAAASTVTYAARCIRLLDAARKIPKSEFPVLFL